MTIPHCGTLCPLERMFELYADMLPTGTWEEECDRLAVKDDRLSDRNCGSSTQRLMGGLWVVVFILLLVNKCGE